MSNTWDEDVDCCEMTKFDYRDALEMLPSAACKEYRIHNCDFCDLIECSDNTSEARKVIREQAKTILESEKKIAAQEKRVAALDTENKALWKRVNELIEEVKNAIV